MTIDQVTADLRRSLGLGDDFPRGDGALALVHSLSPTCRVREVRGLPHAFLCRLPRGAVICSPPGDWRGQLHEAFHVLGDVGLAAMLGRYGTVTAALCRLKEEAAVHRAVRAFLMPRPLCIGLEAWELAEAAEVPVEMARARLSEVTREFPLEDDDEEEAAVRRWLTDGAAG